MTDSFSSAILDIKELSFSSESNLILSRINLHLNPQDFLAIIGPNGAGKSTLLKLILGLLSPSTGQISLLGQDPKKSRQQVGYVSQQSIHDPKFPILAKEVVEMGKLVKGIFHHLSRQDEADVQEALKRCNALEFQYQLLSELSGGQRQRILLARALVNHPKLLILDEPTAAIDAKAQAQFYELLAELNETITIIMVTHDIATVSRVVKQIYCLNQTGVFHDSPEISEKDLEHAYGCEIELLAHGVPHRVLKKHD